MTDEERAARLARAKADRDAAQAEVDLLSRKPEPEFRNADPETVRQTLKKIGARSW